jgi:large subunit ribosomal protein L32e
VSKKFKRPESWKYKRLGEKWHKPRGAKNPARRGAAGRPALPSVGHRKPRDQRGLHPSGLEEVLVHRPEDLEGLSKDSHIVRIAGPVGRRKRELIFAEAKKIGIRVVQNEPVSSETSGQ